MECREPSQPVMISSLDWKSKRDRGGTILLRGGPSRRTSLFLQVLVLGFIVALFFERTFGWYALFPDLPSTLIGYVLAATFVATRPTSAFRIAPAARFFLFFVVFTAIIQVVQMVSQGVVIIGEYSSFRLYLQYAQVVVFYLILQDLLLDARFRRRLVISVFICIIIIAAIGVLVGVGGETLRRSGVRGINLNEQAFLFMVAAIGAATVLLERWPRIRVKEMGLFLVLGMSVGALLLTGSRGALVSLLVGLAVTFLLNARRRDISVYVAVVPVLVIILFVVFDWAGDVVSSRLQASFEEGDTGMRLELAQGSWMLFRLSPLLGIGPGYTEELAREVFNRPGRVIAAHNAYFQMLLSFGVIGALPWFLGVARTTVGVWRARFSEWGAVLMPLFAASLVFGLVGNLGYNKFFWLLLAFGARAGGDAGAEGKGTRRQWRSSRKGRGVFPSQTDFVDGAHVRRESRS